jgi:thymidylate synthase
VLNPQEKIILIKKHKYVVLCCLLLSLGCKKPKTHLSTVLQLEKERVLQEVDNYINLAPITVTSSFSKRSAGTKHDFYSEGDYWWPNPDDVEGPYIRKDGLSNPDNFVAHRQAMIRLSRLSGALVSAYLVTSDDVYLEQLKPHLNAWFIDSATKMNPNLLYAQAIKGRVTGRGIGIIDTIHLVEVALAIKVAQTSTVFSKTEIAELKNWFSEYLQWMTTHEYGIKERDNGNNHSTCWAMQVAAFASLVGNTQQLEFCKTFFKETLLPNQMGDNGGFPKELARTKPYGYSIFNLDAFFGLAQILSDKEDNLFEFTTKDGKSLKLGLEFLYPYLEDKTNWPYKKDVMYWDDWPTKQPSLLFGGLNYGNNKYLNTWEALPPLPEKEEILRNMPVRYPLLWVER